MKLHLVSVPYDSGRRGERMGRGPLHLLAHGLPETLETAGHTVDASEVGLGGGLVSEVAAAVEIAAGVGREVVAARREGKLPIVLAGNCGYSALGVLSAMGGGGAETSEGYGAAGSLGPVGAERWGWVWFDAHGDLNTPETSPSGFFDGMCLAVALGRCWRGPFPDLEPIAEERLALVAVRDLDPPEERFLAGSAVHRVGVGEAGRLGERLAGWNGAVDAVYLHLDLDALDPSVLRANPFAAPDGLGLDAMAEAVAGVAARLPVAAVGVTAYDPSCDAPERGPEVAAWLLGAAVG